MHYFSPEQVPVISELARQFAVCDRWFASAPCQTWPNRFFVHACTANGYENNDPPRFPYEMDTVFNQFERAGMKNWKIYYHDIALSHALSKLWLLADPDAVVGTTGFSRRLSSSCAWPISSNIRLMVCGNGVSPYC